jgi:hypothetical protein
MRSAQVLAVRVLLLGALLASAGCFRPGNLSGRFSCGSNGACPDGLVCNPSNHICVSSFDASVTGTGGKGGTGGAAGTDGGPTDVPPDRPCTGAIASCQQSDAGLCDPVCNTGCSDCFDKCSVNAAGNLTCNAPTAGSPGLLGACAQTDFGSKQTDNCAPGQVCAAPRGNQCDSRCYQFCRTNSDCSNGASCSIDAGGGQSLCDVPPVPCDPVLNAAKTPQFSHCTGNTFIGCYLSSDSLNTVCDCQDSPPDGSSGSNLQPCNRSRDCFPGLVCIDPTGRGKQCRKICRLPGDGGVDLTKTDAGEMGCNNNDPTLCLPFLLSNGTLSTTFGFCND